jgi:hypothetical protein
LRDTSAVIGFCNPTSIKENNNEQVNIYPNPVGDVLYLETSDKVSEVSIYNLMGEKAAESDFENQQLRRIDVSNLKNGVYIIVLDCGNDIVLRRFVKE